MDLETDTTLEAATCRWTLPVHAPVLDGSALTSATVHLSVLGPLMSLGVQRFAPAALSGPDARRPRCSPGPVEWGRRQTWFRLGAGRGHSPTCPEFWTDPYWRRFGLEPVGAGCTGSVLTAEEVPADPVEELLNDLAGLVPTETAIVLSNLLPRRYERALLHGHMPPRYWEYFGCSRARTGTALQAA